MKKFCTILNTAILLTAGGLALSTAFTSCDNFLTAGTFKNQLAQDISFAEAEECSLFIAQTNASGSFPYSSAKETCKLGYSIELQFNAKTDSYIFSGLEAVSKDDTSVSRADCIEFTVNEKESDTSKGIYKISVKLLKTAGDILIRPVCIELPAVKSHTPSSSTEINYANTPIVIEFNMRVEDEAEENSQFNYENISLIYTDSAKNNIDVSQYFEEPVLSANKQTLTLMPKKSLADYIESRKVAFLDVKVYFSQELLIPMSGSMAYPIIEPSKTISVRYKKERESIAPAQSDFFVTREVITLQTVQSLEENKKFTLENIDLNQSPLPEEKIQQNRSCNNKIYIYGAYYDAESGVKNVLVSVKKHGEDSPVSEKNYSATSENIGFYSDGEGNTSFVIEYLFDYEDSVFDTTGTAFDFTLSVKDAAENESASQGFTAFVPPSKIEVTNKPDCTNNSLTIEDFSNELKNLKVYKSSLKLYSDVMLPSEDFKICCEYTDKNKTDQKKFFVYNEAEKPYWNCVLNVDSVADLPVKITVYDGETVCKENNIVFPSTKAYSVERIEDRLDYDDPNYQGRILGKEGNNVYAVSFAAEEDGNEEYASGISYPLSNYEVIDFYTKYTWYLGSYNQNGLYTDLDSFDEILEIYNTELPAPVIKSVSVDESDWKTNGGYVYVTVTLADDIWDGDVYDRIIYSSPNDDTEDKVINKGEYVITDSISVPRYWATITVTGEKSIKSAATRYTELHFSNEDYDNEPPSISTASTKKMDNIIYKLYDFGSGPEEADLTIMGQTFHIDSTDDYTVAVPMSLIEEQRVLNGAFDWTGTDKAGVEASGSYSLSGYGPNESRFSIIWYSDYIKITSGEQWKDYSGVYDIPSNFYTITASEPDKWYLSKSTIYMREQQLSYGYNPKYEYWNSFAFPEDEDCFIKIQVYNSNPQYLYKGDAENSGDFDFLMPNGNSKTSVVICSDAPVFVHTMVTKCPYEKCKDWSIEDWEYYKQEKGLKYYKFTADDEACGTTGNHSPRNYKIPVDDIDEGSCYCVIAYFADGTTLMSDVMQK